jgi:hypothetical protein
MTEFWNSDITEASWLGLQELRKETDFVLIGGWAIYLYSKLQKSKDIDIIVDYGTLRLLESKYSLKKNDRLKKYEIQKERYDIDIYLPSYSVLALPPRDIMSRFTDRLEGFSVPSPEALMALKLGAASERLRSSKGTKDAIDILGLLFYSRLDLALLGKILSEYRLTRFMDLLASILRGFDRRDLSYLNLNENSFSKLKRRYSDEIKKHQR